MNTTTIPLWLSALLPLIAVAANWLNKDRLVPEINAFIATAIIVAAAFFWAIGAHTLSPDIPTDIALVVGYIVAIAASPLSPIYKILAINWADITQTTPPATSQAATVVQPPTTPQPVQQPSTVSSSVHWLEATAEDSHDENTTSPRIPSA